LPGAGTTPTALPAALSLGKSETLLTVVVGDRVLLMGKAPPM